MKYVPFEQGVSVNVVLRLLKIKRRKLHRNRSFNGLLPLSALTKEQTRHHIIDLFIRGIISG